MIASASTPLQLGMTGALVALDVGRSDKNQCFPGENTSATTRRTGRIQSAKTRGSALVLIRLPRPGGESMQRTSRVSSWPAVAVCITGIAVAVLAGCTSAGQSSPRYPASSASSRPSSCSMRMIVHTRQGSGIRNDFELVEAGRRAGIQLQVLQTMGRNSRMIMIRGLGPEQLCEEAAEQLSLDPRIESVQRY